MFVEIGKIFTELGLGFRAREAIFYYSAIYILGVRKL